MPPINSEFIERYQQIYDKDPTSQVFAPLAEAYRKLGLLKEAREICEAGLKHHPSFPSGLVALARILIDLNDLEGATVHLQKVVDSAPENLLAHTLLGETLLSLRKPKEALKSFKMILFLNPNNLKAQNAVKKLESLTADDYESDLFEMTSIKKNPLRESLEAIHPIEESEKAQPISQVERYVSMIDAFMVRNELEKAWNILQSALQRIPDHTSLLKRQQILESRRGGVAAVKTTAPIKKPSKQNSSVLFLEELLKRVEDRRRTRRF